MDCSRLAHRTQEHHLQAFSVLGLFQIALQNNQLNNQRLEGDMAEAIENGLSVGLR